MQKHANGPYLGQGIKNIMYNLACHISTVCCWVGMTCQAKQEQCCAEHVQVGMPPTLLLLLLQVLVHCAQEAHNSFIVNVLCICMSYGFVKGVECRGCSVGPDAIEQC